MIKLIRGGCYYMGGSLVKENRAFLTGAQKEVARKGTMAYGILQRHNKGDDRDMRLKFDAIASHDITYVGIIQTAKASGLQEFPLSYTLTNCHNSLCAVGGTINEDDHVFGLPQPESTARISSRFLLRSSTSICAKRRRGWAA